MPLPSLGGLTNAYRALPGSARRTLVHTGIGTAAGAALGGLTAQEGQRGRGALTGGLIGGTAAGGASYLANRSAGKAITGLRGQNAGLSDNVSKLESSVASLGQENAHISSQYEKVLGKYDAAASARDALQKNYENAQNEINAARAVINGGMVNPAARSHGQQFGTPGSGAVASRPAPTGDGSMRFTQPARDTIPDAVRPSGMYPATQVNPMAPVHQNTATIQTPVTPVTRQQSGVFPVQQQKVGEAFPFPLDPSQGAMLGGLGGLVTGGGLAALDPETRNARAILRNSAIGGTVGALGGYGLTLGGLNGGYSAGHHEGRMKGYNDGAEDLGVASREAVDALLRNLRRFD
jgi:hypothetical protein